MSYYQADQEINSIKEDLLLIKTDKENIKAMIYSDMPRGSKQSDLSDMIAKYEQKECELQRKLARISELKLNILNVINNLTSVKQRKALKLRYIHHMTVSAVADKLDTDDRNARRLINRGINNLEL